MDYKNDPSISIDLVGFSRGAAIANEVAWKLKKNGCKCRTEGLHGPSYKIQNPTVRFLGLFDPVYSFPGAVAWAWQDERIADNVETASIAYARDEVRLLFRHSILSTSSSETTFHWEFFPGRHADVGGYFGNSHTIALVSLKWMEDQAVAAGVDTDISGLPTEQQINQWRARGMLEPGPEELWSGIINSDWTINRPVLNSGITQ